MPVVLGLLAAACSSGGAGETIVLAASSLTEVADDLAAQLEADDPAVEVTVITGGSNALAAQVRDGAPVHVFLTADPDLLAELAPAETAAFGSNRLAVAVPEGNPAGIDSIDDLVRDDLLVARCADGVPCGDATTALAAERGIDIAADSLEASARSVLAKVSLGEVDAGIVYESDALAAETTVDVAWAADGCPCVTYVAADFDPAGSDVLRLLLSVDGQRILERHGIAPPSASR